MVEPLTGRGLYEWWCGDEPGEPVRDRSKYFTMMNPADKRAWDDLAARVVPRSVADELADVLTYILDAYNPRTKDWVDRAEVALAKYREATGGN